MRSCSKACTADARLNAAQLAQHVERTERRERSKSREQDERVGARDRAVRRRETGRRLGPLAALPERLALEVFQQLIPCKADDPEGGQS